MSRASVNELQTSDGELNIAWQTGCLTFSETAGICRQYCLEYTQKILIKQQVCGSSVGGSTMLMIEVSGEWLEWKATLNNHFLYPY